MKIGMISFAHMHARSYASALQHIVGVSLAGIADEQESRGREMADFFGTRWYAEYQDLLRTDVDAVVICSENARHAEMAIAAAKAGKHILCEKPIATTVQEAKAMIQAAEQNGVKLMIAFPCRYSPSIRRAKTMVESGELGRIVAIKGTNRGSIPGGWFMQKELAGGGAVMDHTVHVLDLMRWLMPGAEVREVYAEIDTRFHEGPIDDCGLLSFKFTNDVIASLDPSWSRTRSYPTWGDVTLEITGTQGVTRVDLFKQNLVFHNDDTLKTTWENWGSDLDGALVQDFISCIVNDTDPFVSGEDGLRAMEVALAAYRSANLTQPVRLR